MCTEAWIYHYIIVAVVGVLGFITIWLRYKLSRFNIKWPKHPKV